MIADNAGFNDPAFVKSMGSHGRGPGQPLGLRRRQAGQRARHLQRALQEEDRRRRSRRRVGARPAGLPGAGRRHQPRRLDRSGQDPARAQGHRPAGRADGGGLRRREVRRQGPEHAGLERRHPDARRQVRRDLAQGARHRRGRSCRTRAGKRPRRAGRRARERVDHAGPGDRERAAARRGLCPVLVGPHPDLGHDERRELRARRLRHAGHVQPPSWSGRRWAAGRSPPCRSPPC